MWVNFLRLLWCNLCWNGRWCSLSVLNQTFLCTVFFRCIIFQVLWPVFQIAPPWFWVPVWSTCLLSHFLSFILLFYDYRCGMTEVGEEKSKLLLNHLTWLWKGKKRCVAQAPFARRSIVFSTYGEIWHHFLDMLMGEQFFLSEAVPSSSFSSALFQYCNFWVAYGACLLEGRRLKSSNACWQRGEPGS